MKGLRQLHPSLGRRLRDRGRGQRQRGENSRKAAKARRGHGGGRIGEPTARTVWIKGAAKPESTFLRRRVMNISTVRVSYSWSRCQTRSQSSVRENRSEEHTSELQSPCNLVCRLLLEK